MGRRASAGVETALTVVSGTFAATGQSGNAVTTIGTQTAPPVFSGAFNVALWGTFVATVQLEKSFDGGTTWLPVSRDAAGTVASWTAPANIVVTEPELDILYRLNCTAFTSGTVNYRISQ